MSRRFVAANTDFLSYEFPTLPAAGPANYAAGTVLVVARFVTTGSWQSFIEFHQGPGGSGGDDSVVASFGRRSNGGLYWSDGGTLLDSTDSGTGTAFSISSADNWCLYALTRPAGSNQVLTFHKIPLATLTRTTIALTVTSQYEAGGLSEGRFTVGGVADYADIRLKAFAILPGVYLTGTQLDTIASTHTTAAIISVAATNSGVYDDSNAFATNLYAANTPLTLDDATDADGDNPTWTSGAGGGGPTYEDLAVALSGESTLTSAAIRRRGISVALDAQSSLSAASARVRPVTTALSGESTLAAAASRRREFAAALDAASGLTAAASVLRGLALALSGQSTFTAVIEDAGVTYEDLAVVLSGESTLAAVALRVRPLAVPLSAEGSMTVIASRARLLTTVLSAESTLSASMLRRLGLSATLDGQSALALDLDAIRYLAVSLQGEGVLVASLAWSYTYVDLAVLLSGSSEFDGLLEGVRRKAAFSIAGKLMSAERGVVRYSMAGQRRGENE